MHDSEGQLQKPGSSGDSRNWRVRVAVICAVIAVSCGFAAFALPAIAFDCGIQAIEHPSPPHIGNHNHTHADANAPFQCPAPIPCPDRSLPSPVDNGTVNGDAWDLKKIPLAYRSRTEQGQRGVCRTEDSVRAFKESGIDLESLMSFEPCEVLNLIQGRTMWIFGDSQQAYLTRALMSFMSVYARSREDLGKLKPIGIPSVDYVLTGGDTSPECIYLINDTRICHVRMTRLTHKAFEYVIEVLAHAIPMFRHDVLVFNVGLHYRPVPYLLSQDLQAFSVYRSAMRESMGPTYLPLTLWIDTPPQHFSTPTGDYDTSKDLTADTCAPFDSKRLAGADRGTFNAISDAFISNVSDAHVPTWDVAKRSHFAHARAGDCTHFCHPGVPELWLYMLTKTLGRASPACPADTS